IELIPGLLEMLLICYQLWNASKILLMLTLMVRVISFVHYSIFQDLRRFLIKSLRASLKTITSLKSAKQSTLQKMELGLKLHAFRREHIRLTLYILRTDQLFFSPIIMVFLLCNIPFNVYFLAYVYRNMRVLYIDTFIILSLLAVQ